jgi:hypothetical protein
MKDGIMVQDHLLVRGRDEYVNKERAEKKNGGRAVLNKWKVETSGVRSVE